MTPRAMASRSGASALAPGLAMVVQPASKLVKAFPGLELNFSRGTASQVSELLKSGEAEVGIACPLPDPWERLESWVLFTEHFELVLNAAHPLASRNTVSLTQIAGSRLLPRDYSEQAAEIDAVLALHGLSEVPQDHVGSDHDLTSLLAANVGIAIMPQSARSSNTLRFLSIQDLELTRPVVLYAVAGRQRSPAAGGLIRLLRAADWRKLVRTEAQTVTLQGGGAAQADVSLKAGSGHPR